MIQPSELIINPDGSIFHLHLKPEQLASNVLLVGDPGRVDMVASYFDHIEVDVSNREFHTITGWYNGQKISVLSTGIGTDNIDIVVNELDALANIDLSTREIKREKQSLNLVRIGTSGSLQAEIDVDSFVVSHKSIGFDGMLNFYQGRNSVCDLRFEQAFMQHAGWSELLAKPYVAPCSEELFKRVMSERTIAGVNISAPGFYGPQGRVLRLPLLDADLNDKIEAFEFEGQKITNYEMESSAIYGLAQLLGHQALTICLIIANRSKGTASRDYRPKMEELVQYVLDKLTT